MGELVFLSGVFRRVNGEFYSGVVEVRVIFVDFRDFIFVIVVFSDLRFVDSDGELASLRIYGMFAVDFRVVGFAE